MIAVLHTWGQNLFHHPHVHCIVPGGGLSPEGHWVASRPGFFLSVRVLSRLYRRLFLERLTGAFEAGASNFFGDLAPLAASVAFIRYLRSLRRIECRVGEDVAILTPHRPGRADFPHPVLHERDSLAVA